MAVCGALSVLAFTWEAVHHKISKKQSDQDMQMTLYLKATKKAVLDQKWKRVRKEKMEEFKRSMSIPHTYESMSSD